MSVASSVNPTLFTPSTAKEASRISVARRRRNDLKQIVDMQDVMHRMVLEADIPPQHAAQCARAWCELRTRKREILGIAVPKPVDTTRKPKGKFKGQPSFSEGPPTQ